MTGNLEGSEKRFCKAIIQKFDLNVQRLPSSSFCSEIKQIL